MHAIDRQRLRTMMCEARSRGLGRLEELCARALYTDDARAGAAALMRWELWRITGRLLEVKR